MAITDGAEEVALKPHANETITRPIIQTERWLHGVLLAAAQRLRHTQPTLKRWKEKMPLTFAHPAAVLPTSRSLGRFGVLSALVIGSMAPDFVYFVPLGIHGSESHSIRGLIWFCVPSGMLVFFAYHR